MAVALCRTNSQLKLYYLESKVSRLSQREVAKWAHRPRTESCQLRGRIGLTYSLPPISHAWLGSITAVWDASKIVADLHTDPLAI